MIQEIVGWVALISATIAVWRLSENQSNLTRRTRKSYKQVDY